MCRGNLARRGSELLRGSGLARLAGVLILHLRRLRRILSLLSRSGGILGLRRWRLLGGCLPRSRSVLVHWLSRLRCGLILRRNLSWVLDVWVLRLRWLRGLVLRRRGLLLVRLLHRWLDVLRLRGLGRIGLLRGLGICLLARLNISLR